MVALLVCLTLNLPRQDSFSPGDSWAVERTYHYLTDAGDVDFTDVERTEYKVLETDGPRGYVLSATRTLIETRGPKPIGPAPDRTAKTTRLRFGAGGASQFEESSTEAIADPVAARVDRMQWTTAENRAGISWSRRFPAKAGLAAGKVTVRPHGMEGPDQSLLVSYVEEGTGVKGEGTALCKAPIRIVGSFKLTLTNVVLPGTSNPVKVAINQSLIKRQS